MFQNRPMTERYTRRPRRVNRNVTTTPRSIRVGFPYDEEVVAAVKSVPGARWAPKERLWWFPPSPVTAKLLAQALEPHGFYFDEGFAEILAAGEEKKDLSSAVEGPVIEGLRPFQSVAVTFAEKSGWRVLLADEMGLGKTVEGIAIAVRSGRKPVIVVCPASVKLHWQRHVVEWAGIPEEDVVIVSGTTGSPRIGAAWYVVNYEVLQHHAPFFETLRPGVLIVDEAHYVKNEKAKRSKAVKALANAPVMLALDGTPMMNRPRDLFNVIHLLRPDLFPKFFTFALRYCDGYKHDYGWDFSGASHLDELNETLRSSVMVRRMKSQVLTELPEKERSFVPLEVDLVDYRREEHDFLEWLKRKAWAEGKWAVQAEALLRVNEMRQYACRKKMGLALSWIQDFLESERPLVVFTHHKEFANAVAAKFASFLYTGDVPRHERDKAVDEFQAGKRMVFVSTIEAGGVGITLHRAQDAVFLETSWSMAIQRQAEDRLHRIGQRGAVTCYYLYARGTVEEDIIRLLRWKGKVSDRGLGDDEDVFAAFLKEKVTGQGRLQF